MEDAQARRARLRALREEAASAPGGDEAAPAAAPAADAAPEEPVLKFRNYAVKDDKRIAFERVRRMQQRIQRGRWARRVAGE
jgi:coiled-coil domain-containing protein 12